MVINSGAADAADENRREPLEQLQNARSVTAAVGRLHDSTLVAASRFALSCVCGIFRQSHAAQFGEQLVPTQGLVFASAARVDREY